MDQEYDYNLVCDLNEYFGLYDEDNFNVDGLTPEMMKPPIVAPHPPIEQKENLVLQNWIERGIKQLDADFADIKAGKTRWPPESTTPSRVEIDENGVGTVLDEDLIWIQKELDGFCSNLINKTEEEGTALLRLLEEIVEERVFGIKQFIYPTETLFTKELATKRIKSRDEQEGDIQLVLIIGVRKDKPSSGFFKRVIGIYMPCHKNDGIMINSRRARKTRPDSQKDLPVCEECLESYSSQAVLNRHVKTHADGIFVCECGARYQNQTSLTKHQKHAGHLWTNENSESMDEGNDTDSSNNTFEDL